MLIVCTCIKNVMGILFGPLAFFLFRRLMLSLTLESEMLIYLIEVNGNGPFSRMLFLSSLVNMDASCSFNMFAFSYGVSAIFPLALQCALFYV